MSDREKRRVSGFLQKFIIVLGAIAVFTITLMLVTTPREGRAWRRTTNAAVAGSVCLVIVGTLLIATRDRRR